jgi:hypothetical protein|tara:strand:+ start:1271 stop:1567 length:297 start_codon:yes stop_codon:yes gene_type:complete
MKRFFTLQLKGYNENVPIDFARSLIVDESPFVKYLSDNNALAIRHMKSRATMELYGDPRYLILAKIKYGKVLSGKMNFIELFISHQLQRKMIQNFTTP